MREHIASRADRDARPDAKGIPATVSTYIPANPSGSAVLAVARIGAALSHTTVPRYVVTTLSEDWDGDAIGPPFFDFEVLGAFFLEVTLFAAASLAQGDRVTSRLISSELQSAGSLVFQKSLSAKPYSGDQEASPAAADVSQRRLD
jgi:hypothetical protein